MDPAINRHSQFNMRALAKAKQVAPSVEGAGLPGFDNPGRSLQRNAPSKKRVLSPEAGASKTQSEMSRARTRPTEFTLTGPLRLKATWESPWSQYEKVYDLELAGAVEVAVRKASPIELVHVRTFSKPGAEKVLHMFQQLQHPNIVAALAAFTTDEGLSIILEPMSISLEQVVQSPAYPNERQLAAIIGQVSLCFPTQNASSDHHRS